MSFGHPSGIPWYATFTQQASEIYITGSKAFDEKVFSKSVATNKSCATSRFFLSKNRAPKQKTRGCAENFQKNHPEMVGLLASSVEKSVVYICAELNSIWQFIEGCHRHRWTESGCQPSWRVKIGGKVLTASKKTKMDSHSWELFFDTEMIQKLKEPWVPFFCCQIWLTFHFWFFSAIFFVRTDSSCEKS